MFLKEKWLRRGILQVKTCYRDEINGEKFQQTRGLEPTLELCMKVQRNSALTKYEVFFEEEKHKIGWYRRAFGPLLGWELFLF